MTPREATILQSFHDSFKIHENKYQAYKQSGNGVNINVISFIAEQLLQQKEKENAGKKS
ncbi:type II modification methyltransferase [Mycoplasmopsis canis UFG4]|uniref:Type II modification methyltransferase n=1 Tax=Mycoplasmopsis canis UFG4 TaxID=1131455 RepID=I1A7B0_9BACT|nr:type II modification methyltransferase [Mycoplasmopsis canis UFG4]